MLYERASLENLEAIHSCFKVGSDPSRLRFEGILHSLLEPARSSMLLQDDVFEAKEEIAQTIKSELTKSMSGRVRGAGQVA